MKFIGNVMIALGVLLIGLFSYEYFSSEKDQDLALVEAKANIEESQKELPAESVVEELVPSFTAEHLEAFGTLEIPKLEKTIAIVEGADGEALSKGVGHISQTVYPGQNEQIILSGHRDTVFRNFDKLEIGDSFIVHMPYGEYEYEIRSTKIVPEDDTTVIGEMGEEVLVVTTCYPFSFIGNAPERFIAYAYPVEGGK